jgi:hypothetical protein
MATIEWSHDLAGARRAALVRPVSVFAESRMLAAAEQVSEADIELLQSLVEKSLVRGSGERVGMLETIREFALERLEQMGEQPLMQHRHALDRTLRALHISARADTIPEWMSGPSVKIRNPRPGRSSSA